MTAATLTWSNQYFGDAVAAATADGSFTAMHSALTTASGNSDFPWSICSSDLVSASTRYITLKPKSGGAGRIVFMCCVTSADGAVNTQFQLGTSAPSGVVLVNYFAGATSDTPVNLRGSSSAVFTGQVRTGSGTFTALQSPNVAVGDKWMAVANEEAVAMFHCDSSGLWSYTSKHIFMAGNIIWDAVTDEARGGSFFNNNTTTWNPPAVNQFSAKGVSLVNSSGVVEAWGSPVSLQAAFMLAQGRDNATKKAILPAIQLGSLQTSGGLAATKYQLRQVAMDCPCIATAEELTDGDGMFARAVTSAVGVTWWLCNYKIAP